MTQPDHPADHRCDPGAPPHPTSASGAAEGDASRDAAGSPAGGKAEIRATALAAKLREFAGDPAARGLLGELAHELRNPLAAVRVSIELLRKPALPEAMRERALDALSRQVNALGALVDALAGSQPPGAARAAGAVPGEAAPPPDVHGHARRILIADDNALVRQSMQQLLTGEGYAVRTVADGEAAIALAAAWQPHVVILDAYMPGMSGVDAARRLRSPPHEPRLRLLLMSGVALTDAWLTHARDAGFDDCLDKGSPPAHWLERLRLHTS